MQWGGPVTIGSAHGKGFVIKQKRAFFRKFPIVHFQDMVDGEGRVHRLLSVLITREQVGILSLAFH